MKNIYFPDEDITENDLYFVCYMIERTARRLHQHNCYVADKLGLNGLVHQLSVANVNHSANPLQVEQDWIDEYGLSSGDFDITDVDKSLAEEIPSPTQIGKVYMRLILETLSPNENYAEAILRVYNNDICKTIDNYNCSAFYEPSYVIARAYQDGGF